jgi:hypothetical protein
MKFVTGGKFVTLQTISHYVEHRPGITPTQFKLLWWTSPTPEAQTNLLRHENNWIYDPALVGKQLPLYMKASKAKRLKAIPCYTMWDAGYIKPILVRQNGEHVTVDGLLLTILHQQ